MANCALEGCGKKLKPPKRKFCCNRHKDRYHNINNPRGYYAHLNVNNMPPQEEIDLYHDSVHPFSQEALGQWDD